MLAKPIRLLIIFALFFTFNIFIVLYGDIVGCGGGTGLVTVTAKIVLPDGTEKAFTDTPLPINLSIQLTFSSTVDPTTIESLFSFKKGEKAIPSITTWNDTYTEMTVDPKDLLSYEATCTVTIAAENAAFEDTFQTMTQSDVNGDGKAELIVNARQWEAENKTGRVYLFYGSGLAGRRESIGAAEADATITGENAGDQTIMWWTDDINDDGYADVTCNSTLYESNTGRVYFFYGGSGDAPIAGPISGADADFIITGDGTDSWLYAMAFNDVNGDGYKDIILNSTGCISGCIFIFLGPNFTSSTASEADIILSGSSEDNYISASAATGDINGDGVADIIADATNVGGYSRIYIFYGGGSFSSRSVSEADVILIGEETDDWFSTDEVRDINGDGKDDIIAEAFRYDSQRGRVYIFYGDGLTSKGAADADVIFTGEETSDQFGVYVQIGDITGDATDDIVIGAYGYSSNTGRIYGFLGDSGLNTKGAGDADFIFTGEQVNNYFSPSALGDMNGDGIFDIVGSSLFYPDNDIKGRLYIFYGGSSISSKGAGEANAIITGENDGDWLGYNQLLDVDGDSVMDLFGGALGYGDDTGRGYLFFGRNTTSNVSAAQADIIITGENADDRFTN